MVHVNDIATWRERIFTSLLPVVLVVGTLATASIVPILIDHGMWPVLLIDSLALVWIFFIWRLKHLPYTLRVVNFLAVIYTLSIGLMLTVGAASLSYLLGPPVVAAILLGTRPAIIALALGAASIIGLGATDHITLNVPGWEHEPLKASLVAASNYLSVGAMLSLTCGTLLKGLSQTLAEVRGVAATLETNQAALHELNSELALTSAAVARLNDMVLIARAVDGWDADQPITFVNDAFLRRTGYAREEVVGQSLRMLQAADADQAVVARIVAAIAARTPCNAELMAHTRDGTPFWVEVEMVPFARGEHRASHWVIVGRDITERRAAADAIHRLAFYDVLTGLPNRRLLMDKLDLLVARAADGGGVGALLYLDLDNFKNVNDARGHAAGDALLVHAAARLSEAVRAGDTVARIGGDEFVVLLDGQDTDPAAARRRALAVAQKIRTALGAPLDIGGQALHIAASIGVAMPLRAGISAHELLREADTAMYHAKARGRDGVAVFEDAMLADAQHRLTLEHALAQALDKGELAMHLQLQVGHDGVPAGAELLMRWQADGAAVAPDVFIPIAESSGLIVPLGHWVLREACRAWLALAAAGHPLPLSINVSPVQFRQPDFVDRVRATLLDTGVPPQALIFEVTEGLLVNEFDQTVARMHELAALGIRFSIDDFGTGYSNLAYLRKMPLYELKIDKSFVRDMPHDVNGTAIVQSILAMAHHMGLRVVAEGIETAAQAAFLADNGRAFMQGYLFCRPMPLESLVAQLAQRAPAVSKEQQFDEIA